MGFVAVIPARGGSKGIPKKNIAPLGGRPLIEYTFKAASGSRHLTKIILSTDSDEIADVARKNGVEVPFMRPAAIAKDETPMLEVIQHAAQWVRSIPIAADGIVLLQPTSPFRTAKHIDEAIDLFVQRKAPTVVSVVRVPHQFSPTSVLSMSNDGIVHPWMESPSQILRRQAKPTFFARNGPAILVLSLATIDQGQLYPEGTVGYSMDSVSSIDIDGHADLEIAEAILQNRR